MRLASGRLHSYWASLTNPPTHRRDTSWDTMMIMGGIARFVRASALTLHEANRPNGARGGRNASVPSAHLLFVP